MMNDDKSAHVPLDIIFRRTDKHVKGKCGTDMKRVVLEPHQALPPRFKAQNRGIKENYVIQLAFTTFECSKDKNIDHCLLM